MYSCTYNVRYSETDQSGHLSTAGMLDFFQDCAVAHSAAAGLSIELLARRGFAWVLNSWQADISRMPKLGEQVNVTTNPYNFHGFLGHRNFVMESSEGERLAIADSMWTLVSPVTGVPVHVPDYIGIDYGAAQPLDMDYAPRKIRLCGVSERTLGPLEAARHMLDTNGHVNNTQYVRLAADCLPEDFCFRRLRVEYKRSALPGCGMYFDVYRADGAYTVAICSEDRKVYASVEFSL